MEKEPSTLTEYQASMIDRCLNLDDLQISFIIQYADRILAGEEIDMDAARTEWESFKAEWRQREITGGLDL